MKDAIFYNDLGLMQEEGHTIANKERTICDLLYVFPGFAFDNLKSVDIEMLHKIATIYDNKRLQKDVSKIIKIIESNEE